MISEKWGVRLVVFVIGALFVAYLFVMISWAIADYHGDVIFHPGWKQAGNNLYGESQ